MPSTAWQLPAASGPSGPNAAASTDCPDRSRSRSISIVPPSWSAAILSRSAGPAFPVAVPGCPNATAGTAQIRSSSGSSGATARTVTPAGSAGSAGAADSADSTISGWVCTSRPASAAAEAISGAVCSIHSKDSGMISSRCRARTARMSAAVIRGLAPCLGRA